MKKKKYDISIAYRIYPKISKSIAFNINEKFILAHLCLKSFKKSLGSLKVKVWALLDNCPPKYENLFQKYFDKEDLKLVRLNGIGNYATFDLQLKLLTEQNDSNVVFFAEDDYFYLPHQFPKMISFLINNNDVDFITPFDYPTFYTDLLHRYKSEIRVYDNKHWRSVNSAGCNFLTTKKAIKKNYKIFKIYSTGNTVLLSSWVCLNKYKVFNPFAILKYGLLQDRIIILQYLKAWRYGWRQILFGKKWKIWSPIPSIATTLDKGVIAPVIPWKNLLNKAINDLDQD